MRKRDQIHAVAVVGLLFVLAGCFSSPPSRFYRLSSLSLAALDEQRAGKISVGVGPVSIPGYLDQPQIATRLGENSLSYSEFNRWAEGLKQNLAWTISDNLSGLLGTEQVFTFPWDQNGPVDYQVAIDVIRFEGSRQGQAELVARWRVLDRSGRVAVPMRRSSIIQAAAASDYPEWVAALTQTVADLSREIATEILAIRGKRAPAK